LDAITSSVQMLPMIQVMRDHHWTVQWNYQS